MKRLWLMQLIGNALVLWLGFMWLGIGDSGAGQLAETVSFGLLIAAPWLWLQNATFAYFADREAGIAAAFRKGLRTLAAFAGIVIAFVVVVWALGLLAGPLARGGQATASWLTFHLRKPAKPAWFVRGYLALLWGVRWIVVPVIFLPLLAGYRKLAGRVFWLEYLIALVLGFWVPSLLMSWVPHLTGSVTQVMSFMLRFGVAYLLMITSWIAVSFFSARPAKMA
jgi:hypothetical protein